MMTKHDVRLLLQGIMAQAGEHYHESDDGSDEPMLNSEACRYGRCDCPVNGGDLVDALNAAIEHLEGK